MQAVRPISTSVRAFHVPSALMSGLPSNAAYELGFACSQDDLEAIQRLRYLVFNEEMNEGLDASNHTGLDQDEYDAQCHHLFVRHRNTGEIIGTYRMQTFDMADQNQGFYSATIFDFSKAPDDVLNQGVEIGRACIRTDHRSLGVLYLLWKGLGHFARVNGKRFLFGCCSLTGQDEYEGRALESYLAGRGLLHTDILIPALPSHRCSQVSSSTNRTAKPPRLMRAYLSLGATICSPPAIDRKFKTIDFLAIMDLSLLDSSGSAFFHLRS